MDVNLSPEIENRVKDELAGGQYRDRISSLRPRSSTSSINANAVSSGFRRFAESARPLMLQASMSACSFQVGNERRPIGRS